jgi:hypothetical protein
LPPGPASTVTDRGAKRLEGEVGQVPPGVFHHLDELDVQVLDHDPVDLPHLLRGQRGNPLSDELGHRLSAL